MVPQHEICAMKLPAQYKSTGVQSTAKIVSELEVAQDRKDFAI